MILHDLLFSIEIYAAVKAKKKSEGAEVAITRSVSYSAEEDANIDSIAQGIISWGLRMRGFTRQHLRIFLDGNSAIQTKILEGIPAASAMPQELRNAASDKELAVRALERVVMRSVDRDFPTSISGDGYSEVETTVFNSLSEAEREFLKEVINRVQRSMIPTDIAMISPVLEVSKGAKGDPLISLTLNILHMAAHVDEFLPKYMRDILLRTTPEEFDQNTIIMERFEILKRCIKSIVGEHVLKAVSVPLEITCESESIKVFLKLIAGSKYEIVTIYNSEGRDYIGSIGSHASPAVPCDDVSGSSPPPVPAELYRVVTPMSEDWIRSNGGFISPISPGGGSAPPPSHHRKGKK